MSVKVSGLVSLFVAVGCGLNCAAQSSDLDASPPGVVPEVEPVIPVVPLSPIAPVTAVGPSIVAGEKTTGIDWSALLRESFAFLSLEQGFRYLTEDGTRRSHVSFIRGYVKSLNGLHGWADGDPFLVNYIGHPMQGAVSGFLFVQNDRKYRYSEFGKNSSYWKSRLRAAAYAWAYSEQFEIGPISEASIGHTQAFFPQQGFADQVATPTIGLAWMIMEDALDKYVIRRVDDRVRNGFVRVLVRGGLNPTRSMANAMSFDVPWHRNTRIDPFEPSRASLLQVTSKRIYGDKEVHPLAAPFEFTVNARVLQGVGQGARGSCVGGGAMAAFRVSPNWQIVGDVGGCKLTHSADNFSGDSLTYMFGPRWTGHPEKQWGPFAQLLVGGRTLTYEKINPDEKAALEALAAQQGTQLSYPDHALYTTETENTGLAVAASAGVDVKLNPALALRLVDLGYMHSYRRDIGPRCHVHSTQDGVYYGNNLQLTAGLVLRLGTW